MAKILPVEDPINYVTDAIDNNFLSSGAADGGVLSKIDDFFRNKEIESNLKYSSSNKVFYKNQLINEAYWNQLFPYQFQILDAARDYSVISSVTLPIPPQDLRISMPVPTTVTPTFGGIVVEHAGAPFRNISIRSTFGVTPLKPSAGAISLSATLGNTILGGTLGALSTLGDQVLALTNSSQKGANVFESIAQDFTTDTPELPSGSTGFFQYHVLRKFFEYYTTAKLDGDKSSWRLALAKYSDSSLYICELVKFDVMQSSGSPFERTYNIELKAWGRVSVNRPVSPKGSVTSTLSKNKLISNAFTKLQQARDILGGLQNLLTGIRGDVNRTLFEPLRGAALFCKDALGLAVSVYEMPANIVLDFKDTVINSWAAIGVNISPRGVSYDPTVIKGMFDRALSVKNIVYSSNPQYTPVAFRDSQRSDPLVSVFSDPIAYKDLFKQINLSSLSPAPALINLVNLERNRVRSLDYSHFYKQRVATQQFVDDMNNYLGIGNTTYNKNNQVPTITQQRKPTADDYNALYQLNEVITAYDLLALQARSGQFKVIPSAIDYVANIANASGIAYDLPTSKFAIPFPFGATLENLAEQYLGDPNKALEIITLNGLVAPYIDEDGFDVVLANNGNSNQIILNSVNNLETGQLVILSSNTIPADKRHIMSIVKKGIDFIVTLDGANDLAKLTTTDQAKLHSFLPDTLNSQKLVFIPSQKRFQENPLLNNLPGVNNYDNLLNVGGVSLLLTSTNDIAVNPSSGTRYSFGLSNLIQAARIALSTPQGSLIQHPSYGIDLGVGKSAAEVSAQGLLDAISTMFSNDNRFSKVLGVSVERLGPNTAINLSLQVTGTNHTLPLTIMVPA
jgi:hypothetical protein